MSEQPVLLPHLVSALSGSLAGPSLLPSLAGLSNLGLALGNPLLALNPAGLNLAGFNSSLLLQLAAANAGGQFLPNLLSPLVPGGPQQASEEPAIQQPIQPIQQTSQSNEDAEATDCKLSEGSGKLSDGGSGSKRAAPRRGGGSSKRSRSVTNLVHLEEERSKLDEDDCTMDAAGSLTALANLACAGSRSLGQIGKRGSTLSLSALIPSNSGLDSEDDGDGDGSEDKEIKRLRRKQSNRESARRSRLRKQAETEQLARDNCDMRARLAVLEAGVEPLRKLVQRLVADRDVLVKQVTALGGKVESDPKLLMQVSALLGLQPGAQSADRA